MTKTKRNDLCPCGSGKKYKKCHLIKEIDIKIPKRPLTRKLFNTCSFDTKPRMELEVLRKMEYRDTFIYVFHYGTMFQYLFAYKNEIFQDHIFLKPSFKKRLLSFFGKSLYSVEEMEYGEQVVLSGAMKSLDRLYAPDTKIPLES